MLTAYNWNESTIFATDIVHLIGKQAFIGQLEMFFVEFLVYFLLGFVFVHTIYMNITPPSKHESSAVLIRNNFIKAVFLVQYVSVVSSQCAFLWNLLTFSLNSLPTVL